MSKKEKVTYLRCSLPKCDNPLTGKQRKYCSRKCLIKANCLDRKDVYINCDGWKGGPRGLGIVESSIKKDETYLIGDGRYILDDIPIDSQIWEAAQYYDELHRQNCIDHENKRVIAGLEEFVKSYNKHHDVSYATYKARKLKEQNG